MRKSLFKLCLLYLSSSVNCLRHFNLKTTRETLKLSTEINPLDYKNLIQSTAVKAAKLAGNIILSGYGTINLRNDVISKVNSRDIVTQIDKNSQEIIYKTINEIFPTHDFLGEEDIKPGIEESKNAINNKIKSPKLWICDPLDGTTNYAHSIPLSGVIIAYVENGITLFGLIYDPYRDELFTAWKNEGILVNKVLFYPSISNLGAYLNNVKINCCDTKNLKESVICSGSPPNIKSLDACLRGINLLSPKVRTMRLLGSASIMLSWVACGRITGYFEADLNVWDLAAGALIIEEADGIVTDVNSIKYNLLTRNLVCSNKYIHKELIHELQNSKMWIE